MRATSGRWRRRARRCCILLVKLANEGQGGSLITHDVSEWLQRQSSVSRRGCVVAGANVQKADNPRRYTSCCDCPLFVAYCMSFWRPAMSKCFVLCPSTSRFASLTAQTKIVAGIVALFSVQQPLAFVLFTLICVSHVECFRVSLPEFLRT